MWHVVCDHELLARLKRYFRRVLRRVVVAFKVKASARGRKGIGNSTTEVTAIPPHRRYVFVVHCQCHVKPLRNATRVSVLYLMNEGCKY
jgi:hypothetical protein